MSAIIFEWSPAEAAAAVETTSDSSNAARTCSREEEFRLALDRYMTAYVAEQRRRAEALEGGAPSTEPNLVRASGWRRFLAATREIWAFSQELGRDSRQATGCRPGLHRALRSHR
jgi:hypothetical protein